MKKKICLLLLLFISIIVVTGCGKKEEKKENDAKKDQTPAIVLKEAFEKEITSNKDINEVATTLSNNEIIKQKMMVEEASDYLPGFDGEIKNYTKVVKVQPSISTIPFIFYIFETDNTDSLVKELKDKANLRWNICTEADEMETSVKDNYVFFIMAPKTLEEE